jgi:hypothetical protein
MCSFVLVFVSPIIFSSVSNDFCVTKTWKLLLVVLGRIVSGRVVTETFRCCRHFEKLIP